MSALERGVLVHRILERFVKERRQTDADLLELAEEEFVIAERRGVTGYPLLWDLAKEDIRARPPEFRGSRSGVAGRRCNRSGSRGRLRSGNRYR